VGVGTLPGSVHGKKAEWTWGVLAELESAGLVTLADKGYRGSSWAKIPYREGQAREEFPSSARAAAPDSPTVPSSATWPGSSSSVPPAPRSARPEPQPARQGHQAAHSKRALAHLRTRFVHGKTIANLPQAFLRFGPNRHAAFREGGERFLSLRTRCPRRKILSLFPSNIPYARDLCHGSDSFHGTAGTAGYGPYPPTRGHKIAP
jgi:hypothetical protein